MSPHGHGISIHPENGKEIHILGAIIGDIVDAKIYRELRGFYFADLQCVVSESKSRIAPRDALSFYSTSPWQIIKNEEEISIKKNLISRNFARYAETKVCSEINFPKSLDLFNYRNKVEYGFWYDKFLKKYFFSCFKRGSGESKIPLINSVMNYPSINTVGKNILEFLNSQNISPRILKSCIIRCSHTDKKVVMNLFVNADDFSNTGINKSDLEYFIEKEALLQGIIITNSDQEELYNLGYLNITENIDGKDFTYRYDHFFQIYVPAFELVLQNIARELEKITKIRGKKWNKLLDLFAGVGVFGIYLHKFAQSVQAIEIRAGTKHFAERNAQIAKIKNYSFREISTNNATDCLKKADLIIIDPPRTGIDKKTIKAIQRNLPDTIVYLSCNTKTQAKDFNLLKQNYKIFFNRGYNLFPQTPHIEHLLILRKI